MTRFLSDAADGFLSGQYTNYNAAWNTCNYTAWGSYLRVGQRYDSGWYIVDRAAILFDTSSIPDSDTVTAVSLGLLVASDYSYVDFNLLVYRYNWDTSKGFDNVFDMGAAGSSDGNPAVQETPTVNTSGLAAGSWAVFSGLTTSWINKAGYTRYMVRSSRDAAMNAPTTMEYVSFYAGDHAESYRPYLDVTHGSGGVQRITRIFAQGILSDTPFCHW